MSIPDVAELERQIVALAAENSALRARVEMLERLIEHTPDMTMAAITAMRESERRYRTISELVSDFVFEGVIHPDGRRDTLWATEGFGRMIGLTTDEILERGRFFENVHPEDLPRYQAYTRELLQGRPAEVEMRLLHADGQPRWVQLLVRPEPIAGQPGAYTCLGAGRDITAAKRAELALRESEARYRAVSQLTSDYVFEGRLSSDGRMETLWVTGAYERITGYAWEEIQGASGIILQVHPDDCAAHMRFGHQLMDGQSGELEFRIYRRDQQLRWLRLQVHALALPDQPGVVRCIGAGTDITGAKQAEAALRASEARYRAAVDQQTELIRRVSLPDYRITFANEAYCRSYGRQRDEIIGMRLVDLLPDHLRDMVMGQLSRLSPERPYQVVENTSLSPAGVRSSRQWVDQALFDQNGQVVEIMSVGRDITDRVKAEEELRRLNAELEQRVADRTAELSHVNAELRQSSRLLRTVFNSLTDGLALLSAAGSVLLANQALGSLLAMRPAELIGQRWAALGLPAAALIESGARGGAARAERIQFVDPAGRHYLLDAQVIPLPGDQTEPTQLVIRLSDLTERAQLERVAIGNERLAASGRLAAIVAHEVNTPLQSILHLLYLAEQPGHAEGERARFLELARDEIRRVSDILRRLLSFSQTSGGSAQPLSCNAVVERVLLLTSSSLARRRIVTTCDLADDLPPVLGIADQLTQVLLNLVVNAIDAMPQGGGLSITTSAIAGEHGPAVELTIGDSGPGIPPEEQTQVFEPFFTTKKEGTGLGLAVSRYIVGQHGGQLGMVSMLGIGTRFTIRLPAIAQ